MFTSRSGPSARGAYAIGLARRRIVQRLPLNAQVIAERFTERAERFILDGKGIDRRRTQPDHPRALTKSTLDIARPRVC